MFTVRGAVESAMAVFRAPVKQQGALRGARERHKARRQPAAQGADSKSPIELQHEAEAAKARGGVARHALGKVTRAGKRQVASDAKAELLMPGAVVAGNRVRHADDAESAFSDRLGRYAPETMTHRSPWVARGIALLLLVGGCALNASTNSEFDPSQADTISRLLDRLDISLAWIIGSVQMMGFSLLGYGMSKCLGYALVPKRGMYGKPDDIEGEDPNGDRRIVYGHFSPTVYTILAATIFLFALLIAYVVARLRIYGSLLDASAGSSGPGSGAAGTLGAGTTGAGAGGQPDQVLVFMALALLDVVSTFVVFLCLDTVISQTLRGLRKNTESELRYVEKRGNKANRARVKGAHAGLDAEAALADAPLRSYQADVHATQLDAIHRESGGFPVAGGPVVPDLPEVLPEAVLPEPGHTTPLPYPDDAAAPHTAVADDFVPYEPALHDPGSRAAERHNGHQPSEA